MTTHEIRARYDERVIRVYQAYSPHIAEPALANGRFVAPFQMGRMTWIKPSFNWMMYRCGFASKLGQERALAIDLLREGFEWALAHAALSSFHPGFHASHDAWRAELDACPVRIQWDPERDWRLAPTPDVRSVQIGLSGDAVTRYVDAWMVAITDVTSEAQAIGRALSGPCPADHPQSLERPYPLTDDLAARIIPFA